MKFVKIQSSETFEIYPDLLANDFSNEDAHVADRLQVAGGAVEMRVLIKAGTHDYPACVKNWSSMKSMVKLGICTIGLESDDTNDTAAVTTAERVYAAAEKFKEDSKSARTPKDDREKARVKRQAEIINDILAQKKQEPDT